MLQPQRAQGSEIELEAAAPSSFMWSHISPKDWFRSRQTETTAPDASRDCISSGQNLEKELCMKVGETLAFDSFTYIQLFFSFQNHCQIVLSASATPDLWITITTVVFLLYHRYVLYHFNPL